MKILFTRFPLESAFGGAEVQTLSLMEGLIARGHAVAFAGSCPVLLEECRKRGIPAVEWHIGPPPVTKAGALTFAWRRIGMKKKLERLLAQFNRLDAVCMLSLSEKLLLTETAAEKGVRVLWIEHDRVGRWLSANPWLGELKRLSARATTVPVSALSGKIYESIGWNPADIRPIPNGIDPARLGKPLKRVPAEGDALRLGCIARLSPEKGVDVLIRAMKEVSEKVMLEIVGTGPQEAALRRLARELGLESRISFRGPEKDIRRAYDRFDALVLPSNDNDPFGLVAAEAMTLGLPAIVTDACGIADYLKHGTDALVVQAGSPAELSSAMTSLLDPSVFDLLAKNGPKTASEKFSVKRMVEEYELLLTGPVPPAR